MGLFWFITAIVLILTGVVLLLRRNNIKVPEPIEDHYHSNERLIRERRELRVIFFGLGIFLLIAGLFTVLMNSFHIVNTKNVAYVITFGKVTGTLDNGFAFVAPWSDVVEIDGTNQNINADRDEFGKTEGVENCFTVRLANQTSACVDLTVQWHISGEADTNLLYQTYRGQDDDFVGRIRNNVVKRELINALNSVFEVYNPLAALTGGDVGADNGKLTANTIARMRAGLDKGVVLDKLLISFIHFDDVTQAKLNAYAQALADTQIATQQKLTAEQQRAANEALAASTASNDPGVMYQNCLNLINALAAKDQLKNLNYAGLMCGTGSPPVIVGGR